MASCGEDSGQSSDSIHDFSCTKCEKGNKASHFCPVCNVFYCVQCLQFLCAHGGILGRNEVSRWIVVSASAVSELDCWRHPGRPIQTYCGEHDVVCCSLCSARSHRGCQTTSIKYVDSSSATENELKKTQEEIESVREEIDRLKCSKKLRKSTLGQSSEEAEREVRDYCNRLRDKLDTLERATLVELAKTIETQKGKLQSDIEVFEHLESDITHLSQQDDEIKSGSTNGFTRIKRDKEWLKENQMLLSEMKEEQGVEDLEFVLDSSIETTLSSYRDIGKLKKKIITWNAINKKQLNVKHKSETSCHIMNIVQLTDGTFVVADESNGVKKLDREYRLTSVCRLDSSPSDICCVSNSEVAVSLTNKTIQFITVGNDMQPTRSIALTHTCQGIAHRNGNLYVTDNATSLYVYSLTGQQLQTFIKDSNGEDLFKNAYRIAFSKCGNLIYVTDHKEGLGLVTLDKSGNKVATFRSDTIGRADGVCVAEDGSVLVCGYMSYSVVQVAEKGDEKVTDILVKLDGVNPHGICIDRQKGKLLVACCCQKGISVFDLVKEYIR